jgi:ribosome biogenesis GTPase
MPTNFDSVFIMQSLNHDLTHRRLERYLTLAWQSGAVTGRGADQVGSGGGLLGADGRNFGGLPPESMYSLSARKRATASTRWGNYLKTRQNNRAARQFRRRKIHFVNAPCCSELMAVNAIRVDDSKGRHTTTHRQLIRLESA